jgi:hypothetical protein
MLAAKLARDQDAQASTVERHKQRLEISSKSTSEPNQIATSIRNYAKDSST